MRAILITGLLTFCVSSFATPTLQAALDKARAENKVGAMQMTIIEDGKAPVTVVSGKTKKTKDAPAITSDTLFQIGSTTKSFTAALMLKLQEEGKLKLDDKLGKYFPEYKAWRNVTLRQMLHNNSGIPSYSFNDKFQEKLFSKPDHKWTPKELIAIAAKKPISFKPGKGWEYSNSNFVLSGMVIEKVTGKKIGDLFQTNFFDKSALDLPNTFYSTQVYPSAVLDRMAHAYHDGRDITFDNLSWGNSAGAIVSNSSDLAKWAYDLFHANVFSQASLEQMMSIVSTKTGEAGTTMKEGYGLAVGTRVSKFGRWWGHEGETIAYHAMFLWYPKLDLTIAVLANGEAPKLREFAASVPGYLDKKE